MSAGRLANNLCPLISQLFLRTSVSRLTYVNNGLSGYGPIYWAELGPFPQWSMIMSMMADN